MENNFERWAAQVPVPDLDGQEAACASPVTTYNLSKPMELTTFLALPTHAQKEYLTKLRREYGGTVQLIADMFGCEPDSVTELFEGAGVSLRGGLRGKTQQEAWQKFIGEWDPVDQPPVMGPGDPSPEAPVEPEKAAEEARPKPAPVSPLVPEIREEPEPEPRPAAPRRPEVTTVLRAFRVDLTGPIDAVLRRLQIFSAMVGDRTVCVTVSVEDEA